MDGRQAHIGILTSSVVVSHIGLGIKSLVCWAQQVDESKGQERDHASDHHDDGTECEFLSPGLLNGLFMETAHSHERGQGPAGDDS